MQILQQEKKGALKKFRAQDSNDVFHHHLALPFCTVQFADLNCRINIQC